MQTREQKYANAIFKQVTGYRDNHTEKERKEYGSMAHQLPVLVRTAGLAQALTFVEARHQEKKEDGKVIKPPPKQLLDDLAATLERQDGGKLAQAARAANLPEYMRLTQQVLAALVWYKRFAQSVLGVKSGDDVADKPDADAKPGQEGGQ
jgi:CRISPR-associated protein Cmr5